LCSSSKFITTKLLSLLEKNIFDPNLQTDELYPNYKRTRKF
jgi:hypothetical protein